MGSKAKVIIFSAILLAATNLAILTQSSIAQAYGPIICAEGQNGQEIPLDASTNTQLGAYYFLNANECQQSIQLAYTGLICTSGPNDGDAIPFNLSNDQMIGGYYYSDLQSCVLAVGHRVGDLICISGPTKGQAAIYNMATGQFVDQYYRSSLQDCLNALPSWPTPSPYPLPQPNPPAPITYSDVYIPATTACLSHAPSNQDPTSFVNTYAKACIAGRDLSALDKCIDRGGNPVDSYLDNACYQMVLGKVWTGIDKHPELLAVLRQACTVYHYRCGQQ